ncbi:MAG: flagellar biosynthesis anti-sigma factor FlgM [Desulfonatronovibrionaceae bacterium]
MEISSLLASIKGYTQPSVDKAADKKAEAKSENAGHEDKVSLSNQAKLLQQTQKSASESPETRQEKIESFKVSIENGTYKPDSSKIAEKLLQDEIDILI